MRLHEPFVISPRLLPAVKVEGACLSLEFVGCADNRMVYRWYVDLPDGTEYSGADLKSGIQGCTLQEMFGTFLVFLSACGDGLSWQDRDGQENDNAGLFPPAVARWARDHQDEIDMVRFEIEETGAVLIED